MSRATPSTRSPGSARTAGSGPSSVPYAPPGPPGPAAPRDPPESRAAARLAARNAAISRSRRPRKPSINRANSLAASEGLKAQAPGSSEGPDISSRAEVGAAGVRDDGAEGAKGSSQAGFRWPG